MDAGGGVDRPALSVVAGLSPDTAQDTERDIGLDISLDTERDNAPWQAIEGDGIAALAGLASGSVGMILADLPYGTTPCGWDVPLNLDALWPAYWRVLRPGGAVVLTAVQPYTSTLVLSQPKRFKHEWIWQKNRSGSSFTARYRPLAMHESVLVFGRGRVTYNPAMTPGEAYTRTRTPHKAASNQHKLGFRQETSTTINEGTRYPNSVIVFPKTWRPQDQIHGTQKPVALLEYLIRTYSEPGEIVLDNTMGSGSTGVAALRSGRRFIGIERDPAYASVARARIAHAAAHPDDPKPDRMVRAA